MALRQVEMKLSWPMRSWEKGEQALALDGFLPSTFTSSFFFFFFFAKAPAIPPLDYTYLHLVHPLKPDTAGLLRPGTVTVQRSSCGALPAEDVEGCGNTRDCAACTATSNTACSLLLIVAARVLSSGPSDRPGASLLVSLKAHAELLSAPLFPFGSPTGLS